MADDTDDDSKPTPDPTVLTTEQLLREVDRIDKLTESKIGNLKELLQSQIRGREDVHNAELEGIQSEFALIERQRVEQKADTKSAVDAALAAAEKAVKEQTTASEKAIGVSQGATTKQLEQLTLTFATANAGLTTQLNDLKTRIERIENLRQGGTEQRTEQRAGYTLAVGVLGFLVAVLVAGFVIYAATRR